VQAPSGRFVFTGEDADHIVLIAGGVGITPMMSVARALTDMAWDGRVDFIVACTDPDHFIFEVELARLKEVHDNLHVFVAMTLLLLAERVLVLPCA
jgi:ferredoxin-NADP reductase